MHILFRFASLPQQRLQLGKRGFGFGQPAPGGFAVGFEGGLFLSLAEQVGGFLQIGGNLFTVLQLERLEHEIYLVLQA